MAQYNVYAKEQKYINGVAQDEYRKGRLIKVAEYSSIEQCETPNKSLVLVPNQYICETTNPCGVENIITYEPSSLTCAYYVNNGRYSATGGVIDLGKDTVITKFYFSESGSDNNFLTSYDMSRLCTENMTSTSSMFYGCESLTSLDISNFNTSNVTDMNSMFTMCYSLQSLDLSNFNTSNVTSMNDMFQYCHSLTSLDVTSFNTGKVTDMSNMFQSCYSLTSLDLSSFDIGNVKYIHHMFDGCKVLESLDLSNFAVPINYDGTDNYEYMFRGCKSLNHIKCKQEFKDWCKVYRGIIGLDNFTIINWEIVDSQGGGSATNPCGVENIITYEPRNVELSFELYGYSRKSVSGGILSFGKDTVIRSLEFVTNYDITSMDCTRLCAENIYSMSNMFSGSVALTNLNVSNFNTSSVTGMREMFYGCTYLPSIDLSSFDTSNVTNMNSMFYGCSSLSTIDLSNFDTSNVTNMNSMFYGCSSLSTIDLSNFDTSNVTDMNSMFEGCSSLQSLDLSNFNTSSVTSMWGMFKNCTSLSHIKCKQAFKDWCQKNKGAIQLTNFDTINWEIVD